MTIVNSAPFSVALFIGKGKERSAFYGEKKEKKKRKRKYIMARCLILLPETASICIQYPNKESDQTN